MFINKAFDYHLLLGLETFQILHSKEIALVFETSNIIYNQNKSLFTFYLVLTTLNILLVSATALLSFQFF